MAQFSALLIAAGGSTRLGQPKPLLPWQGMSLMQYQVRALAEAGVAEIVVVLGDRARDVAPFVRGARNIKTIINPLYQQGKTTSIKAGLREIGRGMEGLLLLAVDQPRPPHILARLVQEHLERKAPITQPVYEGKLGHPLLFAIKLMPELLAITEETLGVRDVVERHRRQVHEVPVDSPVVLLDINTEEDYRRAQQLFSRVA